MYTLRTITKNQTFNQCLGSSYTYIDRNCNYEDFRHYYKSCFGVEHVADLDDTATEFTKNTVGFIVVDSVIPIYKDQWVYIMTESGQTFERLNDPNK